MARKNIQGKFTEHLCLSSLRILQFIVLSASFVLNEDGTKVMLNPTDKNQRVAIAKSLFSHANKENIIGSKKVKR